MPTLSTTRRTRRHWRAALLALPLTFGAGVAVTACGSSNGGSSQPAGGGSSQVPGEFNNIPKPASAQPATSPTLQNGTWTQSFQVSGQTPAGVMQFYTGAMPGAGFQPTSPPSTDGTQAYSGTFTSAKTGAQIVVTASPYKGGTGGDQVQLNVQYTK